MADLDAWDPDGDAEILHRMAGASTADPPGPAWIARRLLGPACIRRREHMSSRAHLCRVEDRYLIFVRGDVPHREESYLIGHELAEWFYRDRQHEPNVEEACNRLSASLVATRTAFVTVLRNFGRNVRRLSNAFVCSDTLATLRIAEVTGTPTALVSTHKVWRRGAPAPPFIATDEEVRALAVAPRLRGIKRERLRDAPHRVSLAVA